LYKQQICPNHGIGDFQIARARHILMQPLDKIPAKADYAALAEAVPNFSADGLLALHATLFRSSHHGAGQIRTTALAWNGCNFAHVTMIMPSLEQHFASFTEANALESLSRDDFFDVLANHISELHAISPFSFGNRRTLALHAEQIARAVGHDAQICGLDKDTWDEVLLLSFLYKDHRAIAYLLRGASIPAELFPQSITGVADLPLLPNRDPSPGKKYLRTINRARRELEDYLPEARDEAMAQVSKMMKDAVDQSQLAPACHELGYLRHPKGPIFQTAMLDAINFGAIMPVLQTEQSALERVREIATAVGAGIAQQSRGVLEFLIETVHVPDYAVRGSPHQDRLATQFLNNTAEQNRADLRFAGCQRALDDIAAKAKHNRASNPKRIAAKIDHSRREIAARIRSGDMMMPNDSAETNARALRA
jgi:hypothetical protein